MWLFGMLSLSEMLYPVSEFWLKHVVSNALVPVYLYNLYSLYEAAVIMDSEIYNKLNLAATV